MTMLAAVTDSPALTVAVVSGIIALATGVISFLLNRRTSDDSRYLALIQQAQTSQSESLASARAEITDLRTQIGAMRVELNQALRQHRECEAARIEQSEVIRELRVQLAKTNGKF